MLRSCRPLAGRNETQLKPCEGRGWEISRAVLCQSQPPGGASEPTVTLSGILRAGVKHSHYKKINYYINVKIWINIQRTTVINTYNSLPNYLLFSVSSAVEVVNICYLSVWQKYSITLCYWRSLPIPTSRAIGVMDWNWPQWEYLYQVQMLCVKALV